MKNNKYKSIEELESFESIDHRFLKYIDFLKRIGAVKLSRKKLTSKKYMFLIKNRSVVVFDKEKRRHFSINTIINNENEIKNLFK